MADAVNAAQLRMAITDALYPISAYELADVCVALGLLPPREGEDPYHSKRRYVKARLLGHSLVELVDLGRRIADEYGDEELARVLAGVGAHGVDGELKNLIFAVNGPKPRIVLRDAINNVIDVVKNEEYCLVYDRPLAPGGLTWGELTSWWAQREGSDPEQADTRRRLYERLRASLSKSSPPEAVLFDAYASRYRRELGGSMPALIPQVHLHYDPYTRRELAVGPGQTLARERMDFLLLLPNRARVVIEVDGKQHYAAGDRASPEKYAEMVREDRGLRLAGYEVFRFGGHELMQPDGGNTADAFFNALLTRHGIASP